MVSLSFVAQNAGVALPVIVYLYYEIHHGRVDDLSSKVDETIIATVALSQEIEDIDEDAVADRLNGHSPDDFRLEGGDD
jgi:hypothetical protein